MEFSAIGSMKRRLRSAVAARLACIPATQERLASAAIMQRVLVAPWFTSAGSISVYLSMPSGEVQTQGILDSCLRSKHTSGDHSLKKRVFVPAVVGKLCDDMRMVHIRGDPDEHPPGFKPEDPFVDFPRSKWGIPEPPPNYERNETAGPGAAAGVCSAPVARSDLLSEIGSGVLPFPLVVLIPGVAFSEQGQRLGHGKGYYDCFIRKLRAAFEEKAGELHAAAASSKCPLSGEHREDTDFAVGKRPFLLVGLAYDEQIAPSADGAAESSPLRAAESGVSLTSYDEGGAASSSAAASLPLPPIPVEPHDELLDIIVTPTRTISCRPSP